MKQVHIVKVYTKMKTLAIKWNTPKRNFCNILSTLIPYNAVGFRYLVLYFYRLTHMVSYDVYYLICNSRTVVTGHFWQFSPIICLDAILDMICFVKLIDSIQLEFHKNWIISHISYLYVFDKHIYYVCCVSITMW